MNRSLMAVVVLASAIGCRGEAPATGSESARFQVESLTGDRIGSVVLFDNGREEISFQHDDRKVSVRVQHHGRELVLDRRVGREREHLALQTGDDSFRVTRQKGLARTTELIQISDPSLPVLEEAVLPNDGPLGFVGPWCSLSNRLAVTEEDARTLKVLNLRTLTVQDLFVERRERRMAQVDGVPVPAQRFFVHTRPSGHTLWVSDQGELLFIDNLLGGARVLRARFALPVPPAPRIPENIVEEDFTIDAGEVTLAGTLSRPADAGQRIPAVLIIHGSGPIDRDGGLHAPYRDLAWALNQAGFATVRYDKRGIRDSIAKVEEPEFTFRSLNEDAHRILAWTKQHRGVDPACLFPAGHSEGGYYAAELGAHGDAAGVIMLAGAAGSLIDVLKEQLQLIFRAHDVPGKEIAAAQRQQHALFRLLQSPRTPDERRLTAHGPLGWLASHGSNDPLATWRQVNVPALALYGGGDLQVPAASQLQLLAELDAGRGRFHTEVLPGIDHLLMDDRGRGGMGLYSDPDRRLSPLVPERIIEWLGRQPCSASARSAP